MGLCKSAYFSDLNHYINQWYAKLEEGKMRKRDNLFGHLGHLTPNPMHFAGLSQDFFASTRKYALPESMPRRKQTQLRRLHR